MRRLLCAVVVCAVAGILSNGCVQVMYTKSIKVKKDAQGKIIETEEYEGIIEPHSETQNINGMNRSAPFQYLK